MSENPQPDNEFKDDDIQQGLVADFFAFLREEKIWWILPLILIVLFLVAIAFLGQSAGPLAPFIYPFA